MQILFQGLRNCGNVNFLQTSADTAAKAFTVFLKMEIFAKPSMSFLMKCSVKELYPRYKQITLGTECPRHCGGEVSISMMGREKAFCLQRRRERWRNVFGRGKRIWERRFIESCGMKWRHRCEKYKWYELHSVYVDGVRYSYPVTLQTTSFWDCYGVLSCTACECLRCLWWSCWCLCWLHTFILIIKQYPRRSVMWLQSDPRTHRGTWAAGRTLVTCGIMDPQQPHLYQASRFGSS